jgi:hypothetical protein
MNHLSKLSLLFASSLVCGSAAVAQEVEPAMPRGLSLDQPDQPLKNRFRLSYRAGLNISADFKGLGVFPAQTNPGGPTGSANRTYDDGYVRPDSGANPGLTWNWGYENASQVPGDDTIQFHSSTSPGDAFSDDNDDSPYHGFELTYNRHFGNLGDRATWGLETAFGYNLICIGDNSPVNSSVRRLTDTYALDGVIPPEPPYSGTFEGPGPLISDSPARSFATIPGAAHVTGKRKLDAELCSVRLGPYVEVPLDDARKWNVSFSGGLTLAVINSEFRYRESTAIAGAGTFSSSGSGTDSDFMVGGYFGGNISYSFTRSWSAFLGAAYQYLPDYTHKEDGRAARVTFARSVFVNLGFGFAF